MAAKFAPAVSVQAHRCALARAHPGELVFLEVGDDPDVVERHDGEQWTLGADALALLDGAPRDDSSVGRAHGRIGEVQLRQLEGRLRLQRFRLREGERGARRGDLLRRRLGGAQPPLGEHDAAAGSGAAGQRRGQTGPLPLVLRARGVELALPLVQIRRGRHVRLDQRTRPLQVDLRQRLTRVGGGEVCPRLLDLRLSRGEREGRGDETAPGLDEVCRRRLLRERERRAGAVGCRSRRRQIRASGIELRRIVGRVELHQDLARVDDLVVLDAHAEHLPCNAGRNAHHASFHLGVVGRFATEMKQVPGA